MADQPQPRGIMIPVDTVLDHEVLSHGSAKDVHVTGRQDPPPPDNKGTSYWPF